VLRWLAVPALGDVLTFRLDAPAVAVRNRAAHSYRSAASRQTRGRCGGRLVADSATSTWRRRLRGRWALVAVQVALSFVL
jgi:hypothetical protein